ncbi:T-cell surface glycoprotein CD8 alpha chain [Amblyraja radiata]|uniref:T-cell surface glycoprotein CD8 alpha chain n=1 Tax=Amblyraja radiata TaxID=386614 RepID=UPI0014023466|nr:T-cell surface glycoprotein CD8 alpha chain [Amblyraja radiata]
MSQVVLRRSTMKIVGFLLVIHLTGTAQYSPSAGKVKEGTDVLIDCSLAVSGGVHWFLKRENEKLEHLLYISGVGRITLGKNRRLDCRKSTGKVSLVVQKFTKQDSGEYYCVMVKTPTLEFGNMVARYLEEVKTTPKATVAPTKSPTVAATRKETTCTPATSAMKEDKALCHMFIWAPLAGAAFLQFLALVVVSIVYCKRPRRRRCQHQFKKRPMTEDIRRPLNNYH